MISIPIIVDDVKKLAEFAMTRCLYFTIDSDIPLTGSSIRVNKRKISLYMVGFSGIIRKPLGSKRTFSSFQLIDELFDTIETDPNLFIDPNDIWLPNMIFSDLPHERGNISRLFGYPPLKRGSVYRINGDIFTEAYKFRMDQISQEQFIDFCKQAVDSTFYSEVETIAFNEWEKHQIDETRRLKSQQ